MNLGSSDSSVEVFPKIRCVSRSRPQWDARSTKQGWGRPQSGDAPLERRRRLGGMSTLRGNFNIVQHSNGIDGPFIDDVAIKQGDFSIVTLHVNLPEAIPITYNKQGSKL